ncbi:MAG: cytochrome c biogenesis CcdA family protein [Desulfuromonadales bacterium]|uniref:cytochrome c biogenesis CcdA family protein n=1 Tax=Desulfuromonas sp. KJ2020 TaxID=2919173 RepID=UPI0020A7D7AB|nr:cytochrome c biogenesis protein CcdA [Desulfuromonas sp. KJ2020]MCP3178033.1 cytochrome c biogenesis protein CcdA [Desulfuromonas sp. KJ2020]
MTGSADITIWIAFSAGILSFFSPCVLPLIPSYLTYITGLSFGQLKEAHPSTKVRVTVFLHSLTFIAGFSVVFIALGAIAGVASSTFQTHMREGLIWIQRIGGILIFLFGVHMSGLFHFGVLLGEKRVHVQRKPSGFVGTFLVGLAFAAGWTPCIGPILGGILTLAASSSGGYARGVILLSFYSAGLGIPFLISGVLFHGFLSFFNKFRKHIRIMEIVTGLLLMIVGVMLFFNMFGKLSGYLYRWLPMAG